MFRDHVPAGEPAAVRAAGGHCVRVQGLDRRHQDGQVRAVTITVTMLECLPNGKVGAQVTEL